MQNVCERFLNNKHEVLDILCINNMNINLQRNNFWHEYNFRFWKAMKINIQEITHCLEICWFWKMWVSVIPQSAGTQLAKSVSPGHSEGTPESSIQGLTF